MSSNHAEVLIIGAGPAGCAAAIALARADVDVLLIDEHSFPRAKVCGDGLIPDALQALESLGLKETVLRASLRLDTIRIFVPNGTYFTFRGETACLPRSTLDALLLEEAVSAGARFAPHRRATDALEEDGRIVGAVLRDSTSRHLEKARAPITLLATGASLGPLHKFGVLKRRAPSAVAMRAYYKVPDTYARSVNHLCVAYDKSISPGYGWIFPGPGGVFNIGVGRFLDSEKPASTTLRSLWQDFVEKFEPAREIIAIGTVTGALNGAPLRCNMDGALFHRPGLMVLGEAAGLTYSYIGEGIGKALESGLIAAEAVIHQGGTDGAGEVYETRFRRMYVDRYEAYHSAQRWLARPLICNFLASRARRGDFVTRQLEGMFSESTSAKDLFSFRGLVRSLFG